MFRDLDQLIAPLAVLALVWVISLYQIIRGLKTGEMTYWRKGGGYAENVGGQATGACRRADNPWSFWALFLCYSLVALGTPLAVGYAISVRSKGS